MRYVVRLLAASYRFAAAWADWGFSAAIHQAVIARMSGNHSFKVKATGTRFHYRGVRDFGMLHFFTADSGYFETSADLPIRTIVDAGGNIGCFSVLARAHYPAASIVSLEIEPDNFSFLHRNLASLGEATAVAKALWSHSGPVSFIEGETTQAHSVMDISNGQVLPSITATSLADLMATFGFDTVDILKMDIEGAEGTVMAAQQDETLARIRSIIFECNDSEQAGASVKVFARLVGSDFDGYAFGENVYLVRKSTGWNFRRRPSGLMPIWRQQ